jgi:flavodoxin
MATWTNDEWARRRAAEALEGPTVRRDRGLTTLRRRSLLRGAVVGVAGAVLGVQLSGCSDSPSRPMAGEREQRPTGPTATGTAEPTATGSPILLAYFSRAGENYYYGGRTNLTVGNTEVLAGMISRLIACAVHRIEPADPYPDDYEETVARNVREQNEGTRPAIANPLASIDQYDVVLLGSPIWSVRLPMIMTTFTERFPFAGKTVFPFVTYAVSGLGTTVRDYAALCPGATIGEGLAVRGEEVGDAGAAAEAWLRRIALLTR